MSIAVPLDITEHKRPKLLLVDDQAIFIQILCATFEDDYDLIVTTSGESALALCATHQPDLVLLDVVMPGLNGFEVCKRLKADPATRDIPIIFVTAHDDEASEEQGLDVGAVDFITKPISTKIVRARVKTHVTLKRQADVLRSWVYLDGLTGVRNRRFFDEQMNAEWGRAVRNQTPLSAIMLDVDFFKRYNDHYGHQAGDACLRRLAMAIKASLKRPDDQVARYGGEEFVCLLPDTDLQGALQVAKAIGQHVFDEHIEHLDSSTAPVVTVSLGVCTKPSKPDGSALDFLNQADAQLYAAKAAGRNATCGAEYVPLSPQRQP